MQYRPVTKSKGLSIEQQLPLPADNPSSSTASISDPKPSCPEPPSPLLKPTPSIPQNLPINPTPRSQLQKQKPSSFKHSNFSTPEPVHKPSLKRSRSSPTLSSPSQPDSSNQNPNPFASLTLPKLVPFSFGSQPNSSDPSFVNRGDSSEDPPPYISMSVKLFFWNVRGLNDPNKHTPFVSWLNANKPLFGAILETHIKEPSLSSIMSNLCPNWCYSSNHLSDPDGWMILIWRNSLNVQILSQSSQCVTCKINFPSHPSIYYSVVYASNLSSERVDLWTKLLQLHHLGPRQLLLGLNQIIHPSEHYDPSVDALDSSMFQLWDCLIQMGLFAFDS